MPSNEGFVPMPDGVRLFYQITGGGPEIIFPNGLCYADDFAPLRNEFTLISYDLRNRGRSDSSGGDINSDVEDLEAIRRHFGIERMNLIGHSYIGLLVALYAARFPDNANRVVQIGPMEPEPGTQYPPHLMNADGVMQQVFAKLAPLYAEAATADPVELCRKFWSILGPLYVVNPADAARIAWGRCELSNERTFMQHFQSTILPSIQKLKIGEELRHLKARVLTIHGRKDRSAPYGGGRQWAMMLPDARLVTIADAAHAPWIEAPDMVFDAIRTFFAGSWPETAEAVTALNPAAP